MNADTELPVVGNIGSSDSAAIIAPNRRSNVSVLKVSGVTKAPSNAPTTTVERNKQEETNVSGESDAPSQVSDESETDIAVAKTS